MGSTIQKVINAQYDFNQAAKNGSVPSRENAGVLAALPVNQWSDSIGEANGAKNSDGTTPSLSLDLLSQGLGISSTATYPSDPSVGNLNIHG